MIIGYHEHQRQPLHVRHIGGFVKSTRGRGAVAAESYSHGAGQFAVQALGEKAADDESHRAAQMADGSHIAFRWQAPVDIAVPPFHISQGGTQVGACRFNNRFPPGDACRLFPDERGDYIVAGSQKDASACGNRFMSAAQVNAPRNFARFVKAGNFGVKSPRQQHGLESPDGIFL